MRKLLIAALLCAPAPAFAQQDISSIFDPTAFLECAANLVPHDCGGLAAEPCVMAISTTLNHEEFTPEFDQAARACYSAETSLWQDVLTEKVDAGYQNIADFLDNDLRAYLAYDTLIDIGKANVTAACAFEEFGLHSSEMDGYRYEHCLNWRMADYVVDIASAGYVP